MRLVCAATFVLAPVSAQAIELSCTYVRMGEAPVTHEFSSTPAYSADPARNGAIALFECRYPPAGAVDCAGRSYWFVTNDERGVVAVESKEGGEARFANEPDARALTFVWDRKTGKMQLTANNPASDEAGVARGACTEAKP